MAISYIKSGENYFNTLANEKAKVISFSLIDDIVTYSYYRADGKISNSTFECSAAEFKRRFDNPA